MDTTNALPVTPLPKVVTYRLELYNRYERINPESRREVFAGNGWYVRKVVNGCGTYDLFEDFKEDETAARARLAELLTAPRDGGLTADGLRWCVACNRPHGALFVCPSYSPEIREAVEAHQPVTANGSGVASLLAPFTKARR